MSVWACLRLGLRLLGLWVCVWRGGAPVRTVGRREAVMCVCRQSCVWLRRAVFCVRVCSLTGREVGGVRVASG